MSSLPKGTRLLMYGYDLLLLDTRCSILKMAGFDVCTIAGPSSFQAAFEAASDPYDLLVICHTVPANERISIEFLGAQKHTPVLQIEKLVAPQRLVSEVSRLVKRSEAH